MVAFATSIGEGKELAAFEVFNCQVFTAHPFSHTLHHENFASERHVAVKNDAIMICSILALLKKDLPTPVDQDLNVFPCVFG